MPEEPITTTAEVLELKSQRHSLLRLPNGKQTHGHLSPGSPMVSQLAPGQRVRVEMTPYDFEQARIVGILG